MLLNFTKKKWTKDFLASHLRHDLLYDPFCRTISRLQYRPDLFQYELKAEFIPDLLKQTIPSLSWEECCQRRALDLLKLNRSQYFVSWSGGIDSTVMMISFLKYWPKEALKKITVFLSHSSIMENSGFFDQSIASFPMESSLGDISVRLLESDALLLTGELGDQLFGSDIMGPAVQALGDDVLRKDFREFAPKVIDLWNRKEGSGRALFEHFHPIVEESPFPIRTVFDFFWWLNFSQKWQHVKYRFVELTAWNLQSRYGHQILHFYDTPEFQRWSLDNHDLKVGKDWSSYKVAAKDFIVGFTKNESDRVQPKKPSLALRHFLVEKRIAVTSDLKTIATDDELVQYVR